MEFSLKIHVGLKRPPSMLPGINVPRRAAVVLTLQLEYQKQLLRARKRLLLKGRRRRPALLILLLGKN